MRRFKGGAFDREIFELKFFRQKSKRFTILFTNLNVNVALDNSHESLNDRRRNLRLNFVFFCGQERSVLVEKAKLTQKPSCDWEDFARGFEVESRLHGMVGSPAWLTP
jgi:hypothetical protein